MKRTNYYVLGLFALIALFVSCKKTEDVVKPTSSITVYNGLTDGSAIFANFYKTGKLNFSSILNGIQSASLGAGTYILEKGVISGTIPIDFYAYPDSANVALSVTRDYKPSGMYSIFLAGTRSAIDTLITEDTIPVVPLTDSLLLIRTVNLSNFSVPVSVNILGKASPIPGCESIKYKKTTGFLKVSVKRADVPGNDLTLQIRNAATGALLTYTAFAWRFVAGSESSSYISKPATLIITSAGTNTVAKFIYPIKTK
ncbi:hypothetical protein [Mucilaginibacter kameinonensis]|uniref:hypothetical protein n=1 Tax=Mucilaginibacter kameinonensis TaxID=452286 RepID=UPI000EF82C10|nr:hypothetical protein [Mucilaginibacter kameinonensis]